MDKLNYLEIKEINIEELEEYINLEGFTKEQAIAATMEDSVVMIRRDDSTYIPSIISLSFLALQWDFLPSFLEKRIGAILSKSDQISLIKEEEFLKDKEYVKKRYDEKNYTLKKSQSFDERVSLLLNDTGYFLKTN